MVLRSCIGFLRFLSGLLLQQLCVDGGAPGNLANLGKDVLVVYHRISRLVVAVGVVGLDLVEDRLVMGGQRGLAGVDVDGDHCNRGGILRWGGSLSSTGQEAGGGEGGEKKLCDVGLLLFYLLVVLPGPRDLLLRAKHLFVAAISL
jgi:hypothetical protein